eukprot:72880-Chlamydomonas_euryale.AAC.1
MPRAGRRCMPDAEGGQATHARCQGRAGGTRRADFQQRRQPAPLLRACTWWTLSLQSALAWRRAPGVGTYGQVWRSTPGSEGARLDPRPGSPGRGDVWPGVEGHTGL